MTDKIMRSRWFALGAVLLVACASQAGAQSGDRVLAPINPTQRVVLAGHQPPWVQPHADAGAVPSELYLDHLTLVLARSPQTQQAFEQFLRNQQNPASSDYHHWLTPKEVGERFGASAYDIAATREWLQSQNLRVDSVAESGVRISFSGAASAVGTAFGAEMHYFSTAGNRRIALTAPPRIPAALAPVIRTINGLYTSEARPLSKSAVRRFAAGGAGPKLTFAPGQNYIVPSDFVIIYDVPANYTGVNQTIAIIGRSRVYNQDLENFQGLFSQPFQPPAVIIPPNGIDPGPPQAFPPTDGVPSADQAEATLDVTRASTIAPGANIDLVVSASSVTTDGIAIAASYAVDTTPLLAQIISLSFGDCEGNQGPAGVAFWDNLFSQAAAEGISVFVASGDSGAAGCNIAFQSPPVTQVLTTNYLCSSSYVTCVGGTEFADANYNLYWGPNNLDTGASALSYIPEGAWNEPTTSNPNLPYQAASSGGGVSAYVPTPFWQTGPGVPVARSGRYTPDLSFTAANHDPYLGCFAAGGGDCNEFFLGFFGTSAAAQDMAGIAALLNQKLGGAQGNLNPTLYNLAATTNNIFHDVTIASSGVTACDLTGNTPSMCNNSTPAPATLTGGLAGYLVGPGYDQATGLGSLDVGNFLAGWTTAGINFLATTATIASSANPVVAGASVTFTATVVTTGPNPPTGGVTFLDASTTLGSGTLNSAGTTTFTTNGLSQGQHSIVAVYGGDSNNPGSSSATLTETILASNPAPVLTSLTPSSANAGGGALTLTVSGSNFLPNAQVLWNNTSLATTYISGGTQLQAAVTAADMATAGSATVTVNNPAPGGISNPLTFSVLELFGGSGGYLSMFVNGANLGNSALFQSGGKVGLGTTNPGALFDLEYTTAAPSSALLSNINYNNTAAVSSTVVSAFDMNFMDNSKAANLSKQTARIAYIREAGATGGVTAFDTALTTTEVVNSNALFPVRSINIEGPNMATGTSLSFFTGLYIGSPSGSGTVMNKYALVTEANAGNVGIGTTSPVTPLQVNGDIRVGTSGTNGCLQNFAGTALTGTCSSDFRLKSNILPFAPVLDKLVKLEPVHFAWNTEQYPEYHFGAGRNSGLIAQDVEKVFPELVSVDAHGYKTVNYSELPYLTLAAIRELKSENDSLRAQLADRQRALEELRQEMETRLARLEQPHFRSGKRSAAKKKMARSSSPSGKR